MWYRGQKLVRVTPPFPASSLQWPSNQGIPVLHLSWSVPLRVSSRCVGPFSPIAPVLCHGPALWSPPSWSDGDSPMHVRYSWLLLHLPLTGISAFLQSCLQSPSGPPDVDMATFWCAVFWWIWVYACSTYGLNIVCIISYLYIWIRFKLELQQCCSCSVWQIFLSLHCRKLLQLCGAIVYDNGVYSRKCSDSSP